MFVVTDVLTWSDEKKNVGKIIQCPYHSWTYDLRWKF